MGQSVGKSVFFIILVAAATIGLAVTAASGWLPDWLKVPVTALAAAGLTAGLIHSRILRPLRSLLDELRDNLLGSSVFFDADLQDDSDRSGEPRDPMLCAIDRLRYMAEQMADHGNRIAIAAAEVSSAARHLQSDRPVDTPEAGDLSTTVKRIEGAMNALAQSAAQAAVCAERAGEAGSSGQDALTDASRQAASHGKQIEAAADELATLVDRTTRLEHALADIGSLAQQTELLAVNAAGEAARAGEPGRGFAALANEVRGLVHKTTAATQEVAGILEEIGTGARTVSTCVSELSGAVSEGVELRRELDECLTAVQTHAGTARERMQAVAVGASANWDELVHLGSALQNPGLDLQQPGSQVRLVAHQAQQLAATAETIHGQVVTLGGESQHAHMRFVAQSVAQSIAQAFEQGIDDERISESVLFEDDCTQNADYTGAMTSFIPFAEQVLPQIEEPVIELNPALGYLGAVNKDGHFRTLRRRYSKPNMQEPGSDTMGDAAPGAADEPVERRCGSSTEPFLLQTFKDADKNVMHDISAPIHVHGRHWGAFHMGYRAQVDEAC